MFSHLAIYSSTENDSFSYFPFIFSDLEIGQRIFLGSFKSWGETTFSYNFFLVRFACGVPLILAWLLYDGCYLPSLFHYPVRCLADQHAWSYNKEQVARRQCCHKQHASLWELTHFLMGPASHSSKWGSQKEHKHLPSTAAKNKQLIHRMAKNQF